MQADRKVAGRQTGRKVADRQADRPEDSRAGIAPCQTHRQAGRQAGRNNKDEINVPLRD